LDREIPGEEWRMTAIRIGVVGPGLIWQNAHRPALNALGNRVQVVAFSASSDRRRTEVAQDYPDIPFFLDYQDLIAQPDVDWVLVLTPIALNAPVALAALSGGKNVLLEKPMAHTLAGGEELVRVANDGRVRLYVLEQLAYPAYNDTVRRVIASGELGEVLTFEYVAHELFDQTPEHSAGGYGTTQWRISPDFPLGGLFDGGHHRIARLSTLLGYPDRVCATGHSIRPTYGALDHVLVTLEYDRGIQGTLSHSTVLGEGQNCFRLWGTQGMLSIEESRRQVIIQDNVGALRVIEHESVSDHEAMWRAILDAIDARGEPAYRSDHALEDLRTLFAIERSIQGSLPVRLDDLRVPSPVLSGA
jgi:predicted dehydrogenase